MGLYVYVYNTTQSGSSTDPFVPGASVNVPILEAQFGWAGAASNLFNDSSNGWYWLPIPPNTFFSCAATGFNTVYSYSNGYGYFTIGMHPTGGK